MMYVGISGFRSFQRYLGLVLDATWTPQPQVLTRVYVGMWVRPCGKYLERSLRFRGSGG